jgi:hypothetical protein
MSRGLRFFTKVQQDEQTKVFMFLEYRMRAEDPPKIIAGDLAPNVSCGWESVFMAGDKRDIKLEMRVTKFRFN